MILSQHFSICIYRCWRKQLFVHRTFVIIIIIMLYYRLAEHINKYMSVVQNIVSTLSTKVGIQLLTMSVATMSSGRLLYPFPIIISFPDYYILSRSRTTLMMRHCYNPIIAFTHKGFANAFAKRFVQYIGIFVDSINLSLVHGR